MAIYYRYSSENKEIQYNDLIRIIENEKNKERKIFLEHKYLKVEFIMFEFLIMNENYLREIKR